MSTHIELNRYIGSNYGLYAQTANSATIGGVANIGSIVGAGVGTLTVPANGFLVGDSFKLNMGGHVDSVNNKTLTIKILTNTIALASTGPVTMPTCTGEHWNLEVVFTVRAIGAAGVAAIASTGYFMFTKDASNSYEGENFSLVENTNFNTTVINTLSVEADWNDNTVGNAIYSETMTLTKIY